MDPRHVVDTIVRISQSNRRHLADIAAETYIGVDQQYLRVGSDPYRLQSIGRITAGVYKNRYCRDQDSLPEQADLLKRLM
jgi:hypothetical protein